MRPLSTLFSNARELTLVAGVVLILLVLFSPIPPMALDLAILVNFALSLTILLLTLHVAKPVEFSTFPSLLLISTLLRLSLNIAATRLILSEGYAGEVINSIGSFAVQGNFVVGLVVFLILVVVQYVVVTSGAQRVSEVAARFTLDSMPGQQMSIDADLNMGLIDQKEAIRRRSALEKEGAFYGAMDGASKFVKGDAVASVIILLINLIAGWIIGVAQMGMQWGEALQHFSLLTIGDGIATQMPALIISTATGIIVTRSSADRELSTEVFQQLTANPRIPLIVSGILFVLLLLPDMPKWPILIVGALGYVSWREMRRRARAKDASSEKPVESSTIGAEAIVTVALGARLARAWRPLEATLLERIAALRETQRAALGHPFPPLSFVDAPEIGADEYEIRLHGVRYGNAEIPPERTLAIGSEGARLRAVPGQTVIDPAFGMPALWIDNGAAEDARAAGYTIVDPITVFVTHLGEIMRTEAAALLNRSAVVALLDDLRQRQPGLIEEVTPAPLSIADLQRVLQNLLSEGVAIAPIDLVLEHLADLARGEKDINALTELLRQRMGHAICGQLRGRHRELAVLSLDPRLENQLQAGIAATARRDQLAIDPRLAEKLLRQLSTLAADMLKDGRQPVLLCGGDIRRPLRALTRRSVPRLSILAVGEIPTNIELKSQGIIRLEEKPELSSPPRAPSSPNLEGQYGAALQ